MGEDGIRSGLCTDISSGGTSYLSPPRGCSRYRAENGARVLELDFIADPDKEHGWIDKQTIGMSKRDILIEFYRSKEIFAGRPVYDSFTPAIHVPEEYRSKPFPIVHGSVYFAGWDTGDTTNHAFVLAQYHREVGQVQFIGEFTAYNDALYNMITGLDVYLSRKEFREARPIIHVADPAFAHRDGHTGRTAQQILYSKGYRVKPARSNNWRPRFDDGVWGIEDEISEGTPRAIFNGLNCPKLVKALAGQYRFEERKNSLGLSDTDNFKEQPCKDEASHIANAYEYCMMLAREYHEQYGRKK